MDSTVHYVVQRRGGVATSDAERATKSPYNTYYVPGLPAGPIGNPGRASITAAARPTPGPWLYFVAVNPDTGETRFATNAAAHRANEKLSTPGARRTRRGAERGATCRGAAHRAAVLGSPSPTRCRRRCTRPPTPSWASTAGGYTALEVTEHDLARFVAGLGPEWAGLSLTMPLKEAAFAVAEEVSTLAREVGAVNTLVRTPGGGWSADNTDVHGMTRALQEAGEVDAVATRGTRSSSAPVPPRARPSRRWQSSAPAGHLRGARLRTRGNRGAGARSRDGRAGVRAAASCLRCCRRCRWWCRRCRVVPRRRGPR